MIIDATDAIAGRLATKVAKLSLLGNEVHVINCEKAVMSGTPVTTKLNYLTNMKRGTPAKGPFVKKSPHMLLKRIIRGMLPYRSGHGELAYKRVKCYVGAPQAFAQKDVTKFEDAHYSTLKVQRFVRLADISAFIGGKQ
jgi:large subunit ribosomal protein L13